MKIPDKIARKEYREAVYDIPTEISIPGTKHIIKIKGLKPYTLERLTELWGKRDISIPRDSSETLKGMCIDPYFSIKCACMIALNSYWSIKLLYPIKWRIWAFLREYTEEQMLDIIAEGKKKIPLTAFWSNSAFLTDMRQDWMKMTTKEAEIFQAEQISVVKQLSSKNTLNMESPDGVSLDGKEIGGIDVY